MFGVNEFGPFIWLLMISLLLQKVNIKKHSQTTNYLAHLAQAMPAEVLYLTTIKQNCGSKLVM
jgi:hypothetical protein